LTLQIRKARASLIVRRLQVVYIANRMLFFADKWGAEGEYLRGIK